MKNEKININQSVAILCDGNNIERSIQSITQSNSMLNFDVTIPRILNGRSLNRLIYFREGRQISSKLADRLHENFFGSVVPCHKSADIPLSIKATQLASKVDTIIIMSGDSDYVDLVRHLKSEGVRVEIVAVKETAARILLEEADFFHQITKEDWFEYNKPNRQQNNYRQQNQNNNYKNNNYQPNKNQQTQSTTPIIIEKQTNFDNIDIIKQKLESNQEKTTIPLPNKTNTEQKKEENKQNTTTNKTNVNKKEEQKTPTENKNTKPIKKKTQTTKKKTTKKTAKKENKNSEKNKEQTEKKTEPKKKTILQKILKK
ncbi:NYN domain-containing protein [Candidatus Woesearchaeota archaeon]|nr:NYN domain-containing protein [Candidatus Woesearchaeota archaeon]MCF7901711.1 NYN domain-containing protein [Candidatus Woesearchaeota archaeon]MCF8013978.1 NYN domain-containing protein [Candidatus Woesearchaeota archaeon]